MGILDRARDFVLGVPEPGQEHPGQELRRQYPEPIDFIEALKAALCEEMLNITEEKALIPGHFTVLIHHEAHARLEPAFEIIAREAGKALSREVDRLSRIPYGQKHSLVDQRWAQGFATAPADESEPLVRDIHPIDYTWSLEFVPVMYDPDGQLVSKNYIGIATRLIHAPGPRVVEDDPAASGLSLTVKNPFSGIYESHFILDSSLKGPRSDGSITVSAPFEMPGATGNAVKSAGSEASDPDLLGTLVYELPGQPGEQRFSITTREIIIGRATPTNSYVQLRLPIEVQVSEEHARLRFDDGGRRFEIMDISSFGTWVDEQKITKSEPENGREVWHPLSDGSRINLAGYVFMTLHMNAPRT